MVLGAAFFLGISGARGRCLQCQNRCGHLRMAGANDRVSSFGKPPVQRVDSKTQQAVHLPLSQTRRRAMMAGGSREVGPQHKRSTAYGCWVPPLTRFAGPHCVGPLFQRSVPSAASPPRARGEEFSPAGAGCRLQGTASSPPSTACVSMRVEVIGVLPLYLPRRRALAKKFYGPAVAMFPWRC